MMKTRYVSVAVATMLAVPTVLSAPAYAATGEVASKEEVVYATLTADGDVDRVYVVNTLDVEQAGVITDYGQYKTVKNLTNVEKMNREGKSISVEAPEGKFYYQGNMDNTTQLPWNVDVSYTLDGEEKEASELAGTSGKVEMTITTKKNEKVNPAFYENYLLQISVTLPNTYQNIESTGGMVANVGKNKQITFTVLPEREEALKVEADVKDFEFQGVEIAAVPSSFPIDMGDTDRLTDDMGKLSDGIRDVHSGVTELEDGVTELNKGAAKLAKGSAQMKSGINELNRPSGDIVSGSTEIKHALQTLNKELSGSASGMDLEALSELPGGLKKLADGLQQTNAGLTTLQQNYQQSYTALDGAIRAIPATQVTEEEIATLYASGANKQVVDTLVASYTAAQKVRGTYEAVQAAFAAVDPTLTQVKSSLGTISGQLQEISKGIAISLESMDTGGLAELQKGIEQLATNYNTFHTGIVQYTQGVGQLANSYSELHGGMTSLSSGTNELKGGVGELQDGTAQLNNETKDLPERLQAEINEMIAQFDKSDFKPISFVSPENENVQSVQFVLKTESIKNEEPKEKKAVEEEKKGFWALFKELFNK
ncbi:YhgE/Pip domain-containing protein [Metabacillus iocasae]|uniref:X-X-X-Leu-X-X-Gly heptad repeat protein n=1 Tax=Priestia iocasae TaxID=2291674 RepID=A0ABS2QY35_9BACI|nr:YhgE/Pip domain-containing protein [Metabacillus iocasae]MBM7704345.1 X-X-X-Leu-X-X-Gly heptad repeat protein [Metabacillus iocasae]